MKIATLELELLDDVVVSARGASFGGHGSLDYIPGAKLLGWAATQLYADLEADGLAYDAFHSGRLRFGNGLPVNAEGEMGWPVPRCWTHRKGEEPDIRLPGSGLQFLDGKRLDNQLVSVANEDGKRLDNPLVSVANENIRTLRDGYVIPATGEWLKPARRVRMGTAIHPMTGRAARGQLFGYQSLAAGQRFRAMLSGDDDLPESLFEQICDRIEDSVLHLGRSRSAQYGRARCKVSKRPPMTPVRGSDERTLVLWLISDLAALDEYGQPTLSPQLHSLARGLPKGDFKPDASFTDTRRYSPYNGYRRAHDLERQVIRQGSVLTFVNLDPPLSAGHLDILAAGIGTCREAGLGAVQVNPKLLQQEKPDWPTPVSVDAVSEIPPPEHPLVAWLENQRSVTGQGEADSTKGDREQLEALYHAARRYRGDPPGTLVGPGNSQWGRVVQTARDYRNAQPGDLSERLFNARDGICRDKHNENWGVTTQRRAEAEPTTFRDWLKAQIDEARDPLARLDALARLAKDYIRREVRS